MIGRAPAQWTIPLPMNVETVLTGCDGEIPIPHGLSGAALPDGGLPLGTPLPAVTVTSCPQTMTLWTKDGHAHPHSDCHGGDEVTLRNEPTVTVRVALTPNPKKA